MAVRVFSGWVLRVFGFRRLLVGTRRNQERVYAWMRERHLTPPLEQITQSTQARNPLSVMVRAFRDRKQPAAVTKRPALEGVALRRRG